MQFTGAFHTAKNMRVESIGRADADGRRVVIFSSDRSIHEIAQLRQLSAEIVYDTITGLRVPKEAIHLDDSGTLHVFIQTGIRAERVNVEILREYGDVYLVRDGLETGSPLRPGSTIIVRANNLYHGKVVG
jgi:multidrug efflux pump subunit AcrA (membrane-fusion protein)